MRLSLKRQLLKRKLWLKHQQNQKKVQQFLKKRLQKMRLKKKPPINRLMLIRKRKKFHL
nr:hypothetical protein [Aerococcus urinae]MDK8075258.1 hypothetical protein [Aerococcus urinae]MDK8084871.1 hypothetical protein [Aerococcus urinae]